MENNQKKLEAGEKKSKNSAEEKPETGFTLTSAEKIETREKEKTDSAPSAAKENMTDSTPGIANSETKGFADRTGESSGSNMSSKAGMKDSTPGIANSETKGEEKDRFKRAPSKLTKIKNLSSDMNRVSLVGTIVNKNDELYSFLMDDGTGTVLVLTNDIEKFKSLEEKQVVRVFGKVWGEKDEIEIQADVIQDFSKIDLELFRKVYK